MFLLNSRIPLVRVSSKLVINHMHHLLFLYTKASLDIKINPPKGTNNKQSIRISFIL